MRIADLLFHYAVPGSVAVDMTAESAGISAHAALAPELGLPYQRGSGPLQDGAAQAIVLHDLPAAGEEGGPPDLDRFADLAPAVVHVLFFDRVERMLEHGALDRATRSGYELTSTHRTEHRVFRFAAVFRRPEGDAASARLRLVNEYRFDKLLLDELERSEARLLRERDAEREKVAELRRAHQQLAAERQQLQAECQQLSAQVQHLSHACDEARRDADEQRERVDKTQARQQATFRSLERSRKALSFRLGRATWAAVSRSGPNVFAIPGAWYRTFRGQDEVVEKLRQVPVTGVAARKQSRLEIAAIERSVLLQGLEPPVRPGPGVAGVVGRRFAAELAASTRFRELSPHSWRHLLEAEPPAYVLVTADGLEPGTAWAGWGTPGGRDGAWLLRELVTWCRDRRLPVVYWDTTDSGRRPARVRFDALFSLRPRPAAGGEPAPEVLAPAVEPLVWNPIAVAPGAPVHPIYVGAFDRRGDAAELAALEALLAAAAGRGLEILDAHRGLQGPLATAVRLPAELDRLARRRPAAELERSAIQRAGLLLCAGSFTGRDLPSWSALRGLALGVHVLSTPVDLGDPALAPAVEIAADRAGADRAIDRLLERPLLDGTWRRAFDRLLARHGLRDRLDQIARRCGSAPVAESPPSCAVLAEVRSAADLRALRGFLAGQTTPPAEVRVLADESVEPAAAELGDVVAPARLRWLRPDGVRADGDLGDVRASHVLLWREGTPPAVGAVAELARAAALTPADVLALATERGPDGAAPYRYGELPGAAVIAVRTAALARQLREGAAPGQAAAQLAADGRGSLIVEPMTATGAGSQRSVA